MVKRLNNLHTSEVVVFMRLFILDEFLLMWRPKKQRRRAYQQEEEMYLTPTQDDIDQATQNMILIESEVPLYFCREFQAFNVSYTG